MVEMPFKHAVPPERESEWDSEPMQFGLQSREGTPVDGILDLYKAAATMVRAITSFANILSEVNA